MALLNLSFCGHNLLKSQARGFKTHEVGLVGHTAKCMPDAARSLRADLRIDRATSLGRRPFSIDLTYKMPDLGENSGVISF